MKDDYTPGGPLIPGISYAHGAPTLGGQSKQVFIHWPGSWQAQGGAGGIPGPGWLPIAEQPQVVAPVSTADAIARIPR